MFGDLELEDKLGALLRDGFGFHAFRPYQEEVCRAAAAGRDVLLVMPTGAGKSLCYQLPGVARGGTTLVISPLIALMEDQVVKLQQQGFAAERIHSGRDRETSRSVCRAYLGGRLDFLFIAPERLKVPGFVEMLARRLPTLIAVDEAHCISQWGHDFRPDYRMLKEHVFQLRPAPVIALTATATPAVQQDIVSQLQLDRPLCFIHGFRRTNIAVEVIERSPAERTDVVRALLADSARRPAIIYAPTRKHAEALAGELSADFSSLAYHAGLGASERDSIQASFLSGEAEVVVATVAFGMGIDKPNIRTVIHTALPATLEGYYQEIGRAGRDGQPSRAVLLHSLVDLKMHEFFFGRDYPEPSELARLCGALSAAPMTKEALKARVSLAPEVFDRALEKLWLHGGALVEADETLRRGSPEWHTTYEAQRRHRREQLDKMQRYTDTSACRMLQMVRHFGDHKDAAAPCGICDVCAPDGCIAQTFRAPSAAELSAAERVLTALQARDRQSVGQLHRELFDKGALDRRSFEHIMGGLVRAGLVKLEEDRFDKDGSTITYQRACLTPRSRVGVGNEGLRLVSRPAAGPVRTKSQGKRKAAPASAISEPAPEVPARLVEALRSWRRAEAQRHGVPAFRILTDRVLMGVAAAQPDDEGGLLRIVGLGPALVRKYGQALLAIVASER